MLIMWHNRFSENKNEAVEAHIPRHRESKTKKPRHRDSKAKKLRHREAETINQQHRDSKTFFQRTKNHDIEIPRLKNHDIDYLYFYFTIVLSFFHLLNFYLNLSSAF